MFKDMTIAGIEYKAFMTPKGILNILGLNFDPTILIEWLGKIPSLIKDIADLTEKVKNLSSALISAPDNIDIKNQLKVATDQLDELKKISFDLTQVLSLPFIEDLPTVSVDELEAIGKKPITMAIQFLKLIGMIINAIIKFIFAILGIGAVLKCPENDYSQLANSANSDQLVPDDFNRNIPKSEQNGFLYQIKYSDGRVEIVNKQQLNVEIEENPDIKFNFVGNI